jgi:GxxExxY protein
MGSSSGTGPAVKCSATVHRDHLLMKGSEPGGELTEQIIGLAIKVHRTLGPGLLESVYNRCPCWEFAQAGLEFQREVTLAITYQNERLPAGHLADVIVERTVLLELKSVERLLPFMMRRPRHICA